MHGVTVLVVDDDEAVRNLVSRSLERDGFRVITASDGERALKILSGSSPDLLVLDIVLPSSSGFEVLRQIRTFSDVPVIMLTGRDEEADRVLGLELGADDYVVKPFSPLELASRVRSVLRRTRPPSPKPRLEHGDLVVDCVTREVILGGEPVELTAKEFDLLARLAQSPRQVFTRKQLLEEVWTSSPEWQDEATVTEHVRRVRLKLEADPTNPKRIVTVRGVGYRFEP